MPMVLQVDRLELPMGLCQLRNYKNDYNLKNKSIDDNFVVSPLP